MKLGICLITIWGDIDLIELKVEVSNGISLFSNQVYVQHEALTYMISEFESI